MRLNRGGTSTIVLDCEDMVTYCGTSSTSRSNTIFEWVSGSLRTTVTDFLDHEQDPLLGQVLDRRFELTEYIARGGMGQVYKAVQRPLERVVAVKLLGDVSQGVEEFQQRFFLEASLCSRLSHPNIVRIFDYGCHQEQLFYQLLGLLLLPILLLH